MRVRRRRSDDMVMAILKDAASLTGDTASDGRRHGSIGR